MNTKCCCERKCSALEIERFYCNTGPTEYVRRGGVSVMDDESVLKV